MAQRNPLNQRYQGDGPGGKTKKSATSAKPKSKAAASVYIEKKPVTRQEKKAAQKRREKERQRKLEEKRARTAEKEKAARIAAGLEPEPVKKKGFLSSFLGNASDGKPANTSAEPKAAAAKAAAPKAATAKAPTAKVPTAKTAADSTAPAKSGGATAPAPARPVNPNVPQTEQYKRLRRIYWTLMVAALVIIIGTMGFQMTGVAFNAGMYVLLGAGYLCAIAAFVLDFTKTRPLLRAHQQKMTGGKKSPKQIKHETEAAAFALELEKAREAEKAAAKQDRRGSAFRKQPRIIEAKPAGTTGKAATEPPNSEQSTEQSIEQSTEQPVE